jgi:3-phenylpropionate/trans-cinnamate dioxygenase ferredoxin reductase subunit
VQNATDQAKCVAAVLAGKPLPAPPVPWFWSDQFGHRIQVAGRGAPGDEIVIRRGLATPASQSAWYLRAGRVAAVETVDAAEDFMAARQWIKSGHAPDPAGLADPHVALRELAAARA